MKTVTFLLFGFFLSVSGMKALGEDSALFTVKTLSGKTFKNCHIVKVTPAAITFSHETGVAKVDFQLLDESWKERFHYDAHKAHQFSAAEAKKQQDDTAHQRSLAIAREAEQQRLLLNAALAEENRQSTANPLLPPLAQGPFDPLPTELFAEIQQEEIIPNLPVISHVYTPGNDRIKRSTRSGIYTFSGYNYGYVGYPIFISPSYCTPNPCQNYEAFQSSSVFNFSSQMRTHVRF